MDDCIKKLVLCDKEYEEDTADDWIKLVDRGGLWHARETTFQVFFALEEGVRQYLAQLVSVAVTPDLKSKFFAMDEDILFYLSIATAAFENSFKMITELYMTTPGLCYASAWVEQ